MREVAALAGFYLREVRREPGTRLLLLVAVALLASLLLALTDDSAPKTTLEATALLVVGLVALGTGARAGGFLPADRQAGRTAWLASLAPTAAARRLAPALAGMTAGLVVGIAGGVLVGGAVGLLRPGAGVRPAVALTHLRGAVIGSADSVANVLRIELPSPAPARVELRLLSRYTRWEDAAAAAATVEWHFEGPVAEERARGRQALVHGAPFALEVPPGATAVDLHNAGADRDLLVREGHLLGALRPPLASFLLCGLLLGALAAAVAPAAVFLSRWTSAATASTAAAVLMLAGGLRQLVGELAGPGASLLETAGRTVLGAAGHLGPDLGLLAVVGEPVAGRALDAGALGGLLPALLYAGVALGLVLLPLPGPPASEAS